MISAARLAANRRNALLSTGPKSPSGKARAAINGHRHGLASPVAADPALLPLLSRLAALIAGSQASAARRERAWRIAEAELDLMRVRRVRAGLMEEGQGALAVLAAPLASPPVPWYAARIGRLDPATKAARELVGRLASLDRYERRALSRKKTAVRALHGGDDPRLAVDGRDGGR